MFNVLNIIINQYLTKEKFPFPIMNLIAHLPVKDLMLLEYYVSIISHRLQTIDE